MNKVICTRTNHRLKFKPMGRKTEQHALFFYDIESYVDPQGKHHPYMLCYKIIITNRNFAILDTMDFTVPWEEKWKFLQMLQDFYGFKEMRVTAFAHFHHYDLLTGDGEVVADLRNMEIELDDEEQDIIREITNGSLLDTFTGPEYAMTIVTMNTSSPKFFEVIDMKDSFGDGKLRYTNPITFIDSMNYFPTSLAELGKSVGLYKGELDHTVDRRGNPSLLAEAEEYCKNDVNIIAMAIMNFLMLTSRDSIVPKSAPTATFSLYAREYLPKVAPVFCHDQEYVLNAELDAYMGARTEVYLQNKEVEVYSVDANSLYPFAMAKYKYPTKLISREIQVMRTMSASLIANLYATVTKDDNIGIIAKVTVEIPKGLKIGPLPKRFFGKSRRDSRLVFPTGQFETYLTTEEYKYAYNKGYIKELYEYYLYEMNDIFSEFVKDQFNNKLMYKDKGDQVKEAVSKMLLNSLSGKFGQTLRGKEFKKQVDVKYDIHTAQEKDGSKIYQTFGYSQFHTTKEKIAFDSVPAISAHITANGRLHMLDILDKAGHENVYYIDNDGIKVNKQGYDNLQSYLHDTELGKLKLEYTGLFTGYVAKDYQVRNAKDANGKPVTRNKDNIEGLIVRRKGIPLNATLIEDMMGSEYRVYSQQRATTPFDIMMNKGKEIGPSKEVQVVQNLELHGRTSLPDGQTMPLHLDLNSTYKTILQKEQTVIKTESKSTGITADFRKKD